MHGYGASPVDHWFPWLADTLASRGVHTSVVALPDSHAPDHEAWERTVTEEVGEPDEFTWVVAHSLGGITALRVLAALPGRWRLGGLVLVAGFTGPLAALPILDDYLADDVNAESVAERIGTRVMIRSDDDPYVPTAASDTLARRLGAVVHIQHDAGHFLAADGVATLPLVAEMIGAPRGRRRRRAPIVAR